MCLNQALHPNDHLFPCGKCPECREHIRQSWVFRCIAESLEHRDNYFITLTFDDEHLGDNGNLGKADFQKFLKRLRKRIQFRYVAVSEYGHTTYRKHYHLILFMEKGLENVPQGVQYEDYLHAFIRHTWSNGNVTVSPFSPPCASYVMKYHLKLSTLPYETADKPFLLSSRRPAIGLRYIVRNAEYMKANGYITIRLFDRNYFIPSYWIDKAIGSELRKDLRTAHQIQSVNLKHDKLLNRIRLDGRDPNDTLTYKEYLRHFKIQEAQNTIAKNELIAKKQLKLSTHSL